MHILKANEQERKTENSLKMGNVLKMVSLKRVEVEGVINVLLRGVSVCCYSLWQSGAK